MSIEVLRRQIAAGDIKKGMRVVVSNGFNGSEGNATVDSIAASGGMEISYDSGILFSEPCNDAFTIKPAKVTVGHHVKITEYGDSSLNEIGKIVEDDEDDFLPLNVLFKDGRDLWYDHEEVEYVAPYELETEQQTKEEEETADMLNVEEPATRRPTTGDKVRIVSGPYNGETGTILYDEHDSEPYKVSLSKGDRTNWLCRYQVELVTDEDFRPFVDVLKDVVDGKYENGSVIETDNNKEFLVGYSLSGCGLCLPNTNSASIQLGSNLLNSKARVKPAPKQLSKEAAEKELTEKHGTPVQIKD